MIVTKLSTLQKKKIRFMEFFCIFIMLQSIFFYSLIYLSFIVFLYLIYDNYDIIPNDQDSYTQWNNNYNIDVFHDYILANPKFAFSLFKASYLDI